jgi:hypothetical protein
VGPPRKAVVLRSASLALVLLSTWLFASGKRVAHSSSEANELADLEERMDDLQYQQLAPLFEVVDRQDKPIFEITSTANWNAASVYDSNGKDVVNMYAGRDGGNFVVRSDGNETRAYLGIDNAWAGLRVIERFTEAITDKYGRRDVTSEAARIELGGQATGNYSLKFPASAGSGLLAGIGESKQGTGAIVIGDSQGRRRASMFVGDDNKGMIGIYNAQGKAILTLGEAVGNTGGSLVIGDANSEPRVKMGTSDKGYGVVMTFPMGFPYVPKSGLPGSYMLGCAPGPACQ